MLHRNIAFVDIETTGLGPGRHRIAKIGVVTLDGEKIEEWATLLDPGRRRILGEEEFSVELSFNSQPSGTGAACDPSSASRPCCAPSSVYAPLRCR